MCYLNLGLMLFASFVMLWQMFRTKDHKYILA